MILIKPSMEHLPAYVDALKRGWSPDNLRPEASQEQISTISTDGASFVSSLDNPTGAGAAIKLPDGTEVSRLPSIRRWLWDGEFCGHISLRWQPGTEDLPPTCAGHIGYSVVPWRQGEGLATAALVGILPEAKAFGLRYIDISTSPDNPASIRVVEKSGGSLLKSYTAEKALGGDTKLLFRLSLTE